MGDRRGERDRISLDLRGDLVDRLAVQVELSGVQRRDLIEVAQATGGAGMTAAAVQLDLLAGLDAGLCRYGLPKAGEPRPCDEPATHAACWLIPAAYLDGTPNPRAGSGRIECCRAHANYYASAWVPHYPAEVGSAWIDVLGGAV